MTKALTSALALIAIVAGCNSDGARDAGPVPTVPAAKASASTTTETAPSTSTSGSAPAIALCRSQTAAVTVSSEEGAAGTIRRLWRVRNTSQRPCRSFGYPGMDFHMSSGWLNVQVRRGGYRDINRPPTSVIVAPGRSLYFASYWNDVDTEAGPCKEFDRVKVTLPDNFAAVRLASSGCLNPRSVHVGPVTTSPPS